MQNIKERHEFENYNKLKLLGEGSFGKAFLVERASDKLKCVMKQIDISKMSESEKKETVKEAKILEVLSHPNIVKFIEVFKTKNGKLCIVMDFADGGDLQNKVKEQRGRLFSEQQVLEWFTQICLGLKHIHDRKILHRDLKGQNIFLTKNGMIKIGDFGIAKVLASTMQNARTVVGTPYYLSPEIVQSKPYNFKSDMWSMGVILYELCAQKPPFDAPSLHFLAMKIVRGAYNPLPSSYSSEMKSLVSQLLNTNERVRPDVNKVLGMPIMQNRIKQYLSETIYNKEFSHTILHKHDVFNPKIQAIQNQLAANKIGAAAQIQQRPASEYKSPIALPNPVQAGNQIVPRYNPAGAAAALQRPQTGQQPQQNPINNAINQRQAAQAARNGISPGMAGALGQQQSPKNNQIRPPQYGNQAAGAPSNPKLNYHYQQLQAAQQQRPQSALPQQDAKAAALEAQAKVIAQAEAEAKAKLAQAEAKAKAQARENAEAQAKRLEEEKRHKEKMAAIEQKLKEKENELKRMEDAKKEREQREREMKEKENKERAYRELKKQQESKEAEERIRKIREREAEQAKQMMLMQEQAKKLQEAEMKRKEEIDRLRREEVLRRQNEEKKRNEERQKEQLKAMQERAEKQVQKGKPEGTDINMVVKMAAMNVANNIQNIEKKMNQPSQNIPPIPTQRVAEPQAILSSFDPPKAKVHAPQQPSKQQPVKTPALHQPPQSARQAYSAQDWMKKQQSPKEEVVKPAPNRKDVEMNSEEKLKKENERRKVREEAMKKWRDKWKDRESKETNSNNGIEIVGVAGTPKAPNQPFSDNNGRDNALEQQPKQRQVAQTAQNWRPRDENKEMSQLQEKKSIVESKRNEIRDIIKEKSPQPAKSSPAKDQLLPQPVPIQKCKSPPVSEPSEKKLIPPAEEQKKPAQMISSRDISPQKEDSEGYNDVYKMLEEMAGLIQQDLKPSSQNNDEEEKKGVYSDEEEEDDDDFGEDRDVDWEGARQRKKSPFRGVNQQQQQQKAAVHQQARPSLQEALETIKEAQSDAECTYAAATVQKRSTGPANGQDAFEKTESSGDSEDRDDLIEESTDVSPLNNNNNGRQAANNNFTFMGGDQDRVVFDSISKFTSVEQYRDFLEKELGEEKLMKAYPILKEFGDQILFFEKTSELEKILKGVLTVAEIKKYQPHFATWIFMELQAESQDEFGSKIGMENAMKTIKNINMTTASFGSFF